MTFVPIETILLLLLASFLFTIFLVKKISISPLFIFFLFFGIYDTTIDYYEKNCELEQTYYEELTTIAHSPSPTQLEISYYNTTLHNLQKFETEHPAWLSGKYNWKEQPDL